MIKSPFVVIEDALAPSLCEHVIKKLGLTVPSYDNNEPVKHERIINTPDLLTAIQSCVQESVAEIEHRFNAIVKGMELPLFQQFFENPTRPAVSHGCENSKYARKKWVKVKDVDLIAVIWLKDFNSGVPLDPTFEVYGGKLEFPGYNFSLVAQRGTLVIYPATPHFITAVSPILVGSLEQIKVPLKLTAPDDSAWEYCPEDFPGTYKDWFLTMN